MQEFQVRKDHFSDTRLVDTGEPAPINEGEIRVKIDSFSFTANNITYAVVGERIGYWQFFPPGGSDSDGWGIIPVWGFANVIESRSDEVSAGERLFGYFPPAGTLTIKPVNVSPASLFDGAEHRASLPPGYNIYRRVNAEPGYDGSMDNERSLLYPLLVTSFCLHDMLQDNDYFNAEQVLILSASSKTSIGLAYALAEDDNAPDVIAVTSGRNRESVKALGLYGSTFTYDELTDIDASRPSVIVDMSANGEVLSTLHSHLGDNMRFCSNVGLTHWDESGMGPGFIQERSEMFFAPGHIQKRLKDWGPEEFEKKSSAFVQRTSLKSRDWLKMRTVDGLTGLAKVYADICNGQMPPEEGLIVQM